MNRLAHEGEEAETHLAYARWQVGEPEEDQATESPWDLNGCSIRPAAGSSAWGAGTLLEREKRSKKGKREINLLGLLVIKKPNLLVR